MHRYGLETARLLIYVSCGLVVLRKVQWTMKQVYRGADKSLARPTSRCIFLMVRIFRLMLSCYIYK
jgi:hypothetical protein